MAASNTTLTQGTTLVFATTSYTANIETITQDGPSREEIETTVLSQASGTGRTFIPKDLYDAGSLQITTQCNPDNPPPFTATGQTVTLIYTPTGLTGTYTNTSNLSRDAYTGFVTKTGKSFPLNDKIMVTFTVKLSGNISHTNYAT